MMWYGAGRAVIEGLRTDSLMIPGTSLRASQVLAAAMAVVAAIIWIVKTSKVKKAGGRQLFVDSEQGQLIARGEFYKKKADARPDRGACSGIKPGSLCTGRRRASSRADVADCSGTGCSRTGVRRR